MPIRVQRSVGSRPQKNADRPTSVVRSGSNNQEKIIVTEPVKALTKAGVGMANNQMDQEILAMLKQINEQLQQRQSQDVIPVQTVQAEQNGITQEQETRNASQNQNEQATQTTSSSSDELRKLFAELLKARDAQQDSGQQEQSQTPSQLTGQTQERAQNKNNSVKIAQTASQVLAEAQYELANELDASLKKLKQVITESEKIATKISNLIGQENQSNQK